MSSLPLLGAGAGPGGGAAPNTAYAAAVLADTPLAYYRFAEASGSTFADSSGNALTAGKTGLPTLAKPGPLTGGKAVGGFTSGDFFTMPAGLTRTAGQPISVEFFINPTVAAVSSVFTIGNVTGANFCQSHCPYSDGNVYWDYGTQTGGRLSGAFGALSGAWIHMVLTATTNSMVIYKNGAQLFSQASWVPPVATISGGQIGYFASGGPQNSDVAEFAVYGAALSAARVSAHYAAVS